MTCGALEGVAAAETEGCAGARIELLVEASAEAPPDAVAQLTKSAHAPDQPTMASDTALARLEPVMGRAGNRFPLWRTAPPHVEIT
jgi:hypothetical protein